MIAGKFTSPELKPGKYVLQVTKDGFQPLSSPVELHGQSAVQLTLAIAEEKTSITVTGKSLAFANSDAFYRRLRDIGYGSTYRCDDFTLPMDVGTFVFKSGTMTFLAPIDGYQTGAIFVGHGHFTLKPVMRVDVQEMVRRSGSETAEEDVTDVVFRFTAGAYPYFAKLVTKTVDRPAEAETAFKKWQARMRFRHEFPNGFTQAILEDSTIDNDDADMLAAIYNPKHPAFINAYMTGTPHKDLRFFIRQRVGAIPQLDSPEEVALINCNGDGMDDGIWYSQHMYPELKAHTANSLEDRRLFATRKYEIETVIGKNIHFFSRATISFEPLVEGDRVLKFALLPTLRVSRVTDESGKDLHFIQESRKEDGSFYAILDEAPPMGKAHTISIEYGGDKVLYDAGGGSYYVGARESWYPNLNGFGEKALYDLTFKVPKPNVVISVGKLQGVSEEEGFAVSHWVTPVPVAVAGFNYGKYQKEEISDDITHYAITGYYLMDLPDNLAPYKLGNGPLATMAPHAMTKYALEQTRAQMQLCTVYFGRAPYENVSITEQPNFNFGQSWPSLVYLPISAYIDSTQRWRLFGTIDSNFTGFVQEVTPHEVAHQWFGHSVGWASYHDAMVVRGVSRILPRDFICRRPWAGNWKGDYVEYWDRQKRRILEKNSYGMSANDAGPLWLWLEAGIAEVRSRVSRNHVFEGRLRVADAEIDDVRGPEHGQRSQSCVQGDDARLHREQSEHACIDRIFQSDRGEAHDSGDGPAEERASGLVLPGMGVRNAGAEVSVQVRSGTGRWQGRERARRDHAERGGRPVRDAGAGICGFWQRDGTADATGSGGEFHAFSGSAHGSATKKDGLEYLPERAVALGGLCAIAWHWVSE